MEQNRPHILSYIISMSKSAASEKQSAARPFPSAPPLRGVIWRFSGGGNTHSAIFSIFMTQTEMPSKSMR
jgi:hypothetical protein